MSVAQDTAGPIPVQMRTGAARQAQSRAWKVLGTAFLIWCSLAAAALIMIVTHRRSATDSPTVDLSVERGTVFYQGPGSPSQVRARDSMAVQEGGVIEAGDGGRPMLTLFDGTTVTLLPGSRLQLATVRTGRFAPNLTALSLDLLAGSATIDVSGTLPSGREVQVVTPYGVASLSKGSYLVWVRDDSARVVSYSGRATVRVDDVVLEVNEGQRAMLPLDGTPRGPLVLTENLLRNSDFSAQLQGWMMLDKGEPARPDVGGMRRLVEETIAGRNVQALWITRDSPRDAFNETGVVQVIDQDVSAYRNVTLTAWVKVKHASLSGGGYLGSEYPVMFRVNYTDERGGRPGWTRGFYYANPENRPTTNGELVARGEWYPMLERLSALPERPIFIHSIEVLSAGHDFDAVVADVRLNVE